MMNLVNTSLLESSRNLPVGDKINTLSRQMLTGVSFPKLEYNETTLGEDFYLPTQFVSVSTAVNVDELDRALSNIPCLIAALLPNLHTQYKIIEIISEIQKYTLNLVDVNSELILNLSKILSDETLTERQKYLDKVREANESAAKSGLIFGLLIIVLAVVAVTFATMSVLSANPGPMAMGIFVMSMIINSIAISDGVTRVTAASKQLSDPTTNNDMVQNGIYSGLGDDAIYPQIALAILSLGLSAGCSITQGLANLSKCVFRSIAMLSFESANTGLTLYGMSEQIKAAHNKDQQQDESSQYALMGVVGALMELLIKKTPLEREMKEEFGDDWEMALELILVIGASVAFNIQANKFNARTTLIADGMSKPKSGALGWVEEYVSSKTRTFIDSENAKKIMYLLKSSLQDYSRTNQLGVLDRSIIQYFYADLKKVEIETTSMIKLVTLLSELEQILIGQRQKSQLELSESMSKVVSDSVNDVYNLIASIRDICDRYAMLKLNESSNA